jgi:hypothetical protein
MTFDLWRTEEMTLSDNPIGASYLYLLEPEVRFLEAAVEHLIPTDELGPGARDAGVVVYIDRQLAGTWGVHGRQYRGGPWIEGTPQQGYQSRYTPQEVYRIAIREIDQHCRAEFDRPFAQLAGDRQLRLLERIRLLIIDDWGPEPLNPEQRRDLLEMPSGLSLPLAFGINTRLIGSGR